MTRLEYTNKNPRCLSASGIFDMMLFNRCLCFELPHADGFGFSVSSKCFFAFDGEKGVLGLSREMMTLWHKNRRDVAVGASMNQLIVESMPYVRA